MREVARLARFGLPVAIIFGLNLSAIPQPLAAQQPPAIPRCEVLPLPGDQVSLRIDGVERTRWHFAGSYPRPFFYPFRGPGGESLTRMGHPGAPNHDHHRSIWLAHHDVQGTGFWADQTDARVRQKSWYAYEDGDEEGVMAVQLGWYDGAGRELLDSDLVAALRPDDDGQQQLELQITLRPGSQMESVTLNKTNFGLLAVRVARSLSAHFGGGQLSDSEGRRGEPAIFGQTARWMDYSGPVAVGRGPDRRATVEGITLFDHPRNPRYPTAWHVRDDGWMGASFCLHEPFTIAADKPLVLRYLLDAHRGPYQQQRAESVHAAFAARPGFRIARSTRPHRQYDVTRE